MAGWPLGGTAPTNATIRILSVLSPRACRTSPAASSPTTGGIHLIDPVGKKKYFVARDTEDKCVCSQKVADIPKGGRANVWAKFPSPPEDVTQLSIVIPHFSPLDDVPLSR